MRSPFTKRLQERPADPLTFQRLPLDRRIAPKRHLLQRCNRTVVTNFAFSLPVRHKVRGLSKKRLLRKAVAPLLPREVVHGRKRGFSIPAAAWLRGELEPFARDTLSADTIRRQGFFRPAAVTRVLDDHVDGRADLSRQLWGLLAFTLWYEHHVEGVTRDASLAAVVAD